MPGLTHLQHAQPVLLGAPPARSTSHALLRDVDRLRDWDRAPALSPVWARARWPARRSAWTRRRSPRSSASRGAIANSIDAVSDRDFVAEFLLRRRDDRRAPVAARRGDHPLDHRASSAASTLDDAWSTGSSIMPQKKNPDIAELARGKAGRLIGNLTGLLTTLKGLPLAYNRDLQEDKEPVFDAVDTLLLVLPAMTGHGRDAALRHRPDGGARAPQGFALATDIAEWLVRQGVPFREAHEVAGGCVARAEAAASSWGTSPTTSSRAISARPDARGARRADRARARWTPVARSAAPLRSGCPSSWPRCACRQRSGRTGRSRIRSPCGPSPFDGPSAPQRARAEAQAPERMTYTLRSSSWMVHVVCAPAAGSRCPRDPRPARCRR